MIVYFRNDDVDKLTPELINLISVFVKEQVPLNLEIIPGRIGIGSTLINNLKKVIVKNSDYLEIHQHGFNHFEYESYNEFPESRDSLCVEKDIKIGKELLEKKFGGFFYPVFTPPWHQVGTKHIPILKKMGFKAISAGFNLKYDLLDLSVHSDLSTFDKKLNKSRFATVQELIEKYNNFKKNTTKVGFYMHHRFFTTKESLEPIRDFLKYLKRENVKIVKFSDVLNENRFCNTS